MNVNTGNTYSTSAATNKGMSGLISGMDTEAMVEQMLSGTQNKIDKQEQEKQKIIWQQLKYREIISDLNKFQDTYFGSTSSTNLSSADFFNALSVSSSSKAFSAIASSEAAIGNMSVRVGQLATAYSIKSGSAVSGRLTGTGDINMAALSSARDENGDVSFKVELNGISRTITLSGLQDNASRDDLVKLVQEQIDKEFGSGWIKVGQEDGKFVLTTGGKGNVATITGESASLKLLGVQSGQSNKISQGQMLKDTQFSTALQGDKFEFTINGVEFSFDGEATVNDVIKAVNNSKAGVRLTYSDLEDKFTLAASETGAGRDIVMSQKTGNLLTAMFGDTAGLTSGTSAVSRQLTTGEVKGGSVSGYGNSFSGGTFSFQVDGKSYSISISGDAKTREDVFKAINEGLASRFGYDEHGNQNIKLEEDGSGYKITVKNGAKVTFEQVIPDGADADKKKELAEKNIQVAFGFDGASNIVKSENEEPARTLIDSLKNQLAEAGKTNDFEVTFEDGRIVLTSKNGKYAGVNLTGEAADIFGTAQIRLGQATGEGHAQAVVEKGQNAIAEINGVVIERSSNTFTTAGLTITLNEPTGDMPVLSKAEVWQGTEGRSYRWENDVLTMIGSDGKETVLDGYYMKDGAIYRPDGSLWGKPSKKTEEYWTDQNDAVYYLNNGQITDKDGRVMDAYKGLKNLEIKDGYIVNADGDKVIGGSTETISTSRNTDKIVEGLKSFVDAYNSMIEKLNGLIHADATYRDYPPLTSAQKKEMTEREIELWEEKAQEGLFRNDSDISSFLQNMRIVLYSKPEGAELSLYDIGIESSSEWRDYGKLEFDEAKVRSMVEANPQAVQQLFTSANDGLAALMNKELNRTANTSSASAGTLVEKAGVPGKATSITNQMTQRLISINERIDELKKKYETEKNRYWKQFNAMEKALSDMNTQSSWLAMQFSY